MTCLVFLCVSQVKLYSGICRQSVRGTRSSGRSTSGQNRSFSESNVLVTESKFSDQDMSTDIRLIPPWLHYTDTRTHAQASNCVIPNTMSCRHRPILWRCADISPTTDSSSKNHTPQRITPHPRGRLLRVQSKAIRV